MANITDQVASAYARMKGDERDQGDHLALAVGILMGGGWPASAAAVILAWEALDPDGPRPDVVEAIIRLGQRQHEEEGQAQAEVGGLVIPKFDHFEELKDYALTHPGCPVIFADQGIFRQDGSLNIINKEPIIDDEIPF